MSVVIGNSCRLIISTAKGREPVGQYVVENQKQRTWQKTAVPCPYCKRSLSKRRTGPRVVGRVKRVVLKDPQHPHALYDPMPKGYSVLSCGPCAQMFTVPNWRLRKAIEK